MQRLSRGRVSRAPECIEINGLEDAVKLAVCLFVKFDAGGRRVRLCGGCKSESFPLPGRAVARARADAEADEAGEGFSSERESATCQRAAWSFEPA